jgi:plastocyanin
MSFSTITILSLLVILAIGIFFSLVIPLSFAEEVITILPGAQDHNRPRVLDITFYPIERGKELTWFNDDDVSHGIVINATTEENNNTELVANSGIIRPGDSYTNAFEEEGTYHFSSPTYPWIKGTVYVSNDISTVTQTDSENNIDVQLSWTPSFPKVGQQTHFKIIFINKEKEENQKHIDYRFSIQDPAGKKIDLQSPHSGWGVESASYTFDEEGEFKPRISIFNINFIPVEVGVTEFELVTSTATK